MRLLRRAVSSRPTRSATAPPAAVRAVLGSASLGRAVLGRALLGVLAGATAAFVVALLRPQPRQEEPRYLAPVPPGELRV